MAGFDQQAMVDEAALLSEKHTCSQCRFLHELPCPEEDWEYRDPTNKPCVCFEETYRDDGQ